MCTQEPSCDIFTSSLNWIMLFFILEINYVGFMLIAKFILLFTQPYVQQKLLL